MIVLTPVFELVSPCLVFFFFFWLFLMELLSFAGKSGKYKIQEEKWKKVQFLGRKNLFLESMDFNDYFATF